MRRENGVSVYHHTLGKTFMIPFKTYYSQAIENWLVAHPFRAVTMFQEGGLMGKAYIKAGTVEVAIKGFKSTGIMPYNPQTFSDVDLLAHQEVLARRGRLSRPTIFSLTSIVNSI